MRYFVVLYEDLRKYLEELNGSKQMKLLHFKQGQTIYNTHMQGSSMADVHIILMALFFNLPVLMTEDSDIGLLKTMSRKRMNRGDYSLQIYSAIDLMKEIAQKKGSLFLKKDLERILNEMGERRRCSETTAIWNEDHNIL